MSPFLFSFYVDSMENEIFNSNIGCSNGISRCNILAYKDDIVLLSLTASDMEILYVQFMTNMNEHLLTVNRTTTKCVIYSNKMNEPNESIGLNLDTLLVKFINIWARTFAAIIKKTLRTQL